jgi:hypothetical protein
MKRYRDTDDVDEHGVVRPGGRVRVPVTMMDHDTVTPQRTLLRDALHRPGFRTAAMLKQYTTDAATDATLVAARAAKEAAYMDYQRELISSWRSPESRLADEYKNPTAGKGDPPDAGTHELRGKEGDDCTLTELRRKSDEELSNAWRQT